MTSTPGADEHRIRRALDERGVSYTPTAPARVLDWFDEYVDATTDTKPPPPGPPPARPAAVDDGGGGEPGWEWRRLLSWPYARPTVGAVVALIPWFGGYSPATKWGAVLSQARAEAGVGAAWVIAAVGFGAAAVLVHRRRTWPAYSLLVCAFVGTVAMASPYDIVQFVTGATS